MIAMFDYNATENSPNANPDEELSFRSDDIIYVFGNVHDDGFYYGQLENGSKGLVPSNFLKELAMINADEASLLQNNETMLQNDNKVRAEHRSMMKSYDCLRCIFLVHLFPCRNLRIVDEMRRSTKIIYRICTNKSHIISSTLLNKC
jgi:hypothetical protein